MCTLLVVGYPSCLQPHKHIPDAAIPGGEEVLWRLSEMVIAPYSCAHGVYMYPCASITIDLPVAISTRSCYQCQSARQFLTIRYELSQSSSSWVTGKHCDFFQAAVDMPMDLELDLLVSRPCRSCSPSH